MRGAARIGLKLLLWTAIVLLLAIVIVPPFLDRIYYRGPASDHFDGRRFHNPEGERAGNGGSRTRTSAGWLRFLAARERRHWPASIPVRRTRPPARVQGQALRVTWIGHATALVQTRGLNILTDPIWSDRASPVAFAGPRRVRAPGVRLADLPRIDLVLVSHNHYDHLDLPTLRRLWLRDRPLVVTALGNDAVLRQAGVPAVTRDWNGIVPIRPGIAVIVERVHHWGSRWGVDRNRALWSGFTVVLPGGNLFFAGDTGWGDGTWVADAARHGPFRLALLPIGAYRPRTLMTGNHIDPAQAVAIFRGLGARHALGVHWGTFPLSDEGPDDPPRDLADAVRRLPVTARDFRTLLPGRSWTVGR